MKQRVTSKQKNQKATVLFRLDRRNACNEWRAAMVIEGIDLDMNIGLAIATPRKNVCLVSSNLVH
jgi:hypothetical protein